MSQLDELLAEMRAMNARNSAFMARLQAGGITNGVLESFTDVFPTSGIISRQHHVQCGSLVVINASTHSVTVTPGPPGSSAPVGGPGVQVIPASTFMTVPINDHVWTAWGTATDQLSWQAFTGLQAYGVGALAL